MTIYGLTDRETAQPKMKLLGKLRKGDEKTNPKKPGAELPYFRFTSDYPEIVAAFEAAYGNQPKEINLILLHDTVEQVFPNFWEAWDASGLIMRSDGLNWLRWRAGDRIVTGEKPHVDHPDQSRIGRLFGVIPELLAAGFVGIVAMETKSKNDLVHITETLLTAERLRMAQNKTLYRTRVIMRRVPEKIGAPGFGDRAGKRAKVEKHMVKLELPPEIFTPLLAQPSQAAALLDSGAPADPPAAALPTPSPASPASPAKPTPSPAPESKWPESGPVFDLYSMVQDATGQWFQTPESIAKAAGGLGDLNNPDVFQKCLEAAVKYAFDNGAGDAQPTPSPAPPAATPADKIIESGRQAEMEIFGSIAEDETTGYKTE